MAGSFEWPIPPHFKSASGAASTWPEESLVVFNDGRKITGDVLRFFPHEGRLKFQPRDAAAFIDVEFDKMRHVFLTRPFHLARKSEPLETLAAEALYIPETQVFNLEYQDGEKFTIETMGYVIEKFGIFLFLVTKAKHLQRCFIPTQSIKEYHLGTRIGQMLVESNVANKDDVKASLEKQQEMRSKRIGDYLMAARMFTSEQLATALKRQQVAPALKLGEALLQEKLITDEQLKDALANQRKDRKLALGEILIKMGVIDKETIRWMLVKKLGIPFVNLKTFQVDPDVVKLITESTARDLSVMPLFRTGSTLVVAMEDPINWEPLDTLRFQSGLKIEPVLALSEEITAAIETHYASTRQETAIKEMTSELEKGDDVEQSPDAQVDESDSALVRLVNKIIVDAYQQGVSDIHIETYPGKKNTRVRFRKDGALKHYMDVPANFRNALVSRIKIMSVLDISERRRPQDGKIDFRKFGYVSLELRVATIPTVNGMEDIVMRVLTGAEPIPLEGLGLAADNLAHLKQIAARSYGMFLICGPTGSGKSTTLHTVLRHINTPDRKIWTAEDPIEITQEGLRQVQVNAKLGWTFAAALRTFLRADPDVIMVGEMRDQETASSAIKASLTGHLVFSTLHTNSASESISRLLDMGMDPFNFSDALVGVLSQRLAKSLCPACRQPHTASADEVRDMLAEYCLGTAVQPHAAMVRWRALYADTRGNFTLFNATGCAKCDKTGYRGRVGLHELLVVTPAIKRLIHSRAVAEEIAKVAIADGMRTLKQDGLEKILQGRTDIAQIRAVAS